MSREFVAASQRADWQVAPSEPDLANYDDAKIKYRKEVEEMVDNIAKKNLKKKIFITISVNVLCADIDTKSPDLDPINRDIYLPLEICLLKWNMADRDKSHSERKFSIKHWIINPGNPTRNCINRANDHAKDYHKIDVKRLTQTDSRDEHVESDLNKVLKEINSFLTPDRVVFSRELRNCRQDLGALKWLVLQTGAITNPIKVYSLEDLFVILTRKLSLEIGQAIGNQSIANSFLNQNINPYEEELKCDFHRELLKKRDEDCGCCAKALAQCSTNGFLDNISISDTLVVPASGDQKQQSDQIFIR